MEKKKINLSGLKKRLTPQEMKNVIGGYMFCCPPGGSGENCILYVSCSNEGCASVYGGGWTCS